mmetsp:Transcript_50995/g.109227  ORF Transcript_50995/g.109227 Transcript_50995/m.109227 type:complete len:219 (-) Transcript_50995:469-1125(-)
MFFTDDSIALITSVLVSSSKRLLSVEIASALPGLAIAAIALAEAMRTSENQCDRPFLTSLMAFVSSVSAMRSKVRRALSLTPSSSSCKPVTVDEMACLLPLGATFWIASRTERLTSALSCFMYLETTVMVASSLFDTCPSATAASALMSGFGCSKKTQKEATACLLPLPATSSTDGITCDRTVELSSPKAVHTAVMTRSLPLRAIFAANSTPTFLTSA